MSPRYCLIDDTACIALEGNDAAAFLHAQVSRAVAALPHGEAPLAGWHDARGRVRAVFRVVRSGARWLLLTDRSIAEPTAARLRLFVLRAAVRVSLERGLHVAALLDAPASWLTARGLPPQLPAGGAVEHGGMVLIGAGHGLIHVIGAQTALESLGSGLAAASADEAGAAAIRLGIPTVTTATVEHFVAQMLNLDLLGAVSFDKGCYPGQEVIARVHHLGSVKRRMRRYAAALPTVPAAGSPVVAADGTEIGEVVTAKNGGHGVEILAVVEHGSVGALLYAAGHAEVPLHEQPLPYEVPPR